MSKNSKLKHFSDCIAYEYGSNYIILIGVDCSCLQNCTSYPVSAHIEIEEKLKLPVFLIFTKHSLEYTDSSTLTLMS